MRDPAIFKEPIPFIHEEFLRQAAEFRTWPDRDWSKPTFCPGWTRKHIVAHLTQAADFYEQVITAGIKGNPRPPYGAADKKEFFAKRSVETERLLALPPESLVDEFEVRYHSFIRLVKSLGSEDLRASAWHPMGLIPAGQFAGMRLYELALHDWDVRVADNPGAGIRTNLLTPLLRALPFMQIRFLNLRPAAQAPDGAFRFAPSEAAPWTLKIAGGLAELNNPDRDAPEIAGEGEALILHATGRSAWREEEKKGRLAIRGDRPAVERLLDALSVSY